MGLKSSSRDYVSSIMSPHWGLGMGITIMILGLFHPGGVTILTPRWGLGLGLESFLEL